MSAPLLERIRTGLPPALSIGEITELEHPDDPVARDTLARHIGRSVDLDDLPATEGSEIVRVWRDVACPPAPRSTLYTPLPIQRRLVNHFRRVWRIDRSLSLIHI